MELPLYVERVIERLACGGYEAYAVGGCVRDTILGVEPKDYDVTTNAKPDEVIKCFSDYRVIQTGIKYGTVTVLSDMHPIEVTTYRVDGEYNDNRRPESVTFTSLLAEDLKRRDFTVNSMAFNSQLGIIDLFDGQEDLKNGIIRAIGDPIERFNEDGLRIMRALRFASTYNLKIEDKTSRAIHNCKHLLRNISGERIAAEFNKMICGECENILREYPDVFSVFIPELEKCVGFEQHTKYHNRDVYEHIIATVKSVEPVKHLRLTMLFHDIGKPQYFKMGEDGVGHFKKHAVGSCEIAERVLKELKYDNDTTYKVIELIKSHDIEIRNDEKLVKKYLNRYGEDLFFDIISVHIADDMGKAPEFQSRIHMYQAAAETADRIIAEKQCFSLKDLAVNGNDMKKLGFKGKDIGYILNSLLESVIEGKYANEKDILISEAIKLEVVH